MKSKGNKNSGGAVPERGRDPDSLPSYEELLPFFSESTELFCIVGFDGTLKRMNPAFAQVLGWSFEKLTSRPLFDFVHVDDHANTADEMEKLIAGAITINFENRFYCKGGGSKWLQWTASPLVGLREIYAVARDVTLRKRMETQIIDTLEQERERVGRDLHDSLGPVLVSIRYAASFLAKELRQHNRLEAQQADEIGEMAGNAIDLARDLVQEIYPVKMVEGGLSTALQNLANKVSSQTGVSVVFCEYGDPHAAPEVKLHLYRIAQEALHNVCKHSGAQNVAMILNRSAGSLQLSVTDDGVGKMSSPAKPGGMGMDSMRYRAHLLGGDLQVEFMPGEGTIVCCDIPNRPPRFVRPPA